METYNFSLILQTQSSLFKQTNFPQWLFVIIVTYIYITFIMRLVAVDCKKKEQVWYT